MDSFDHNKLLKKVARERLKPFNILQKGQSRTFLYDKGLWTAIIEFQPSSWSRGTYLNVAADFHLYPRDYFAFAYGGREKSFEEAENENDFSKIVNDYCDQALLKVAKIKVDFIDISSSIKTLENLKSNDPWKIYDLGILYALNGQINPSKRCLQIVYEQKCDRPFEFERQKIIAEILEWFDNDRLLKSKLKDMINRTRQLKKLPIMELA